MIVWYVLLVLFLLVAATEISTFRTGVPTIASFPASRRKIAEVLARELGNKPCSIIDLGSGNGQLAAKIAHTLPHAKVTGIEISFVPWLISKLRRAVFGPRNLDFQRVDFWSYDCSTIDAVAVYLTGPIMERIGKKLRAELRPGAIIATNEIPLQGGWNPVEVIETGFLNMKIFVYRQG